MLLRPTFTFIPPALPSPVERLPIGGKWIHEIKHDGYRMMVRRDACGVRLLTRNGKDWTGRSASLLSHCEIAPGYTTKCDGHHGRRAILLIEAPFGIGSWGRDR
jgi:ATP-dependent DNA ligase